MSSVVVATQMAHVHGPLSRTNTAPAFSTRSAGSLSGPGLSQTMSHNSRSSQLSGSTAYASSSSASLSSMTSSTTLLPPQSMATPNPGPVQATNNIINQRADASRSLYQICVNLRRRLAQVPGFDAHLTDSDDEDEGEDMDPVSSLWRCLRKGTPLLTVYNSIQPAAPLLQIEGPMDEKRREKLPKLYAFKFVEACLKGELLLPPGDCFSLQDLFGDDTTGFVKVCQVINIILDEAERRGLLMTTEKDDTASASAPGSKMSRRDHVVLELVNTERKYVQDLENLHELKTSIEQKGIIPGDVVHDIFLNINAILDFQRRFLIKVERTNETLPYEQQRWGLPFANYEEAFSIYQPFIANQRRAASIAMREFDKISQADHPVVVDFNTLDGFLLKPMQRLVKYPLLLKDLRDNTDADEETKADLTAGIEAASRVLTQANAAVDREQRNEALEDLCVRVDDWKNHRVDQFGDLLLYGQFPVITGKGDVQKEVRPHSPTDSLRQIGIATGNKARTLLLGLNPGRRSSDLSQWDKVSESSSGLDARDQRHQSPEDLFFTDKIFHSSSLFHPITGHPLSPKHFANNPGFVCPSPQQYTIYLFERILLCCKEVNPNKSKDKLMGAQKDKRDKKDKNKTKEPNKNAKLQLKGRIFMTNVTEVLSFAKKELGSYSVQIFWKGDPGVENFIIKYSNEETMKKWYAGMDGQRKENATSMAMGSSPDGPPADFAWMRDQTAPIPNPYAQQDDDDDDEDYPQQNSNYPPQGSQPNSIHAGPGMTRNASSTSLRSRSTTGGSTQSLAGIARAPPPRFPMGIQKPLSLQTNLASQMPSPGQREIDSYFSPVAESPASSRTSTTSSMFPFPRQGTPSSGYEDYTGNRYTAPAMPRAPSRGSQAAENAYQMNSRQRPSLPAVASNSSQASAAQQRSRSYSTPDINAQNGARRPNGAPSGPVPAVPGIPAHLHPAYDAAIPRSQNNSPNGLPVRSNTQSPGVQRERLAQSSQYPNGTQYANGPQYARSNTTMNPMTSVDSRTMSPPLGGAVSGDGDMALPTQLKVKVNCDGNYVTLVVAFNITYQSLIDRIDAKVGRFSNNAIARGTMRLRYRDEDGDFVTIESDEDIQIAFQEWRESQKLQYHTGQLGEIELFCLSVDN